MMSYQGISILLSLVGVFISCTAFLTVLFLGRTFASAVRRMEAAENAWASRRLSPGDDLVTMLAPYIGGQEVTLLESGFVLFVSDVSLLRAPQVSLTALCERWKYDYRILVECDSLHGLNLGSKGLEGKAVSVSHELRSALELPTIAVMFIQDRVLIDCAAHVYFPHALQTRFSLVAAR